MENEANDLLNRRESEQRIKSVGVGYIVVSRPGVTLIDFYRTSNVLAKDMPPVDKIEEKPT